MSPPPKPASGDTRREGEANHGPAYPIAKPGTAQLDEETPHEAKKRTSPRPQNDRPQLSKEEPIDTTGQDEAQVARI